VWSGEPPHNNSQHIISYGTFFSSSCLHVYGHEAKQSFHRRILAQIEGLFLPQFLEDPFVEDDPTRTFARWRLFLTCFFCIEQTKTQSNFVRNIP
jgi:hypothetical protein